ncbi:MAG: MinD/ParA family protein [bacterium]|nr:MinD/ParA family protein [bacterium]
MSDNGKENSSNGRYKPLDGVTAKIWAIAGGKGGTGKSVVTANLGIALSSMGNKVVVIDGDLGGANLHTCLSIRHPQFNLNDFLTNEKTHLRDILLDTPAKSLKLISGGSELVGIANIQHMKKQKLLRHILQLPADYILVDLGAGTSYNTLDFFNLSREGIVVCNPEPNAKLDVYAFMKSAIYRRILSSFKKNSEEYFVIKKILIDDRNKTFQLQKLPDMIGDRYPEAARIVQSVLSSYRLKLIMNKIRKGSQVSQGHQLVTLASEYLGIDLKYLGHISRDDKVVDASERMMPFILQHPRCKASQNLYQIIKILNAAGENGRFVKQFGQFKKEMKTQAKVWK